MRIKFSTILLRNHNVYLSVFLRETSFDMLFFSEYSNSDSLLRLLVAFFFIYVKSALSVTT